MNATRYETLGDGEIFSDRLRFVPAVCFPRKEPNCGALLRLSIMTGIGDFVTHAIRVRLMKRYQDRSPRDTSSVPASVSQCCSSFGTSDILLDLDYTEDYG